MKNEHPFSLKQNEGEEELAKLRQIACLHQDQCYCRRRRIRAPPSTQPQSKSKGRCRCVITFHKRSVCGTNTSWQLGIVQMVSLWDEHKHKLAARGQILKNRVNNNVFSTTIHSKSKTTVRTQASYSYLLTASLSGSVLQLQCNCNKQLWGIQRRPLCWSYQLHQMTCYHLKKW